MRSALARTDRYTSGAIAFHWTIAALVLCNLSSGLLIGGLFFTHKAIGITVLVLTLGRIVWRMLHPVPPLPATVPAWQRLTARTTHWMLYALTLLLPITGWIMVSASTQRRPLDWFGVFDIPYLPVQGPIGGVAHESHELLGWFAAAVVTLHIAAALYHHFGRRDGVLARMLPIVGTRRRSAL